MNVKSNALESSLEITTIGIDTLHTNSDKHFEK